MFKSYFQGIYRDRYVLGSLISKDLQVKYRRSILGVGWAILTPLGLVLIIGTVYSIIFGSDPKIFIPALFAGLNPWLFISGSADGGTGALIGAEGYLKQTTVNAQIFPIRVVSGAFVNLLYSVLAFFLVYMFLQPKLFGPIMLMTIPGLVMLYLFALSIANFAAVINLNVRDYQPLQSLIMQGLFYATPVIFDPSMLDSKGFSWLYQINPFYYMLEIVKAPMLGRALPSGEVYLIAVLLVVGLFSGSVICMMRAKKEIAFKL